MARLLVVDDEPGIRFLTKKILEKEGHEVDVADSSEECFEILNWKKPSLILMDATMPGMDGWGACKKIKEGEKTQDIPVAMFTVFSSEDSMKKRLECGADAHIKKPFNIAELRNEVGDLLK